MDARAFFYLTISRPLQGRKTALMWLLGCVLLASCAAPRGLVRFDSPSDLSWVDDGSLLQLNRAIDHSTSYYRRLSPQEQFHYGELSYSPEEMIASLELFRTELYAARSPEAFAARLAERFHVFESIRQEGDNLFTGYYEPELPASEAPRAGLDTPLYALPNDIVKVRLELFGTRLPNRTLMGRVVDGELVPYFSRAEIQAGAALEDKAQPIAYVNEIDLFFLQVQGSGVLRFADGRRIKVGYVASNGHPYRSIGAVMVRKDLLALEEVSLQSIRAYLALHPERARGILFANPSYVFFRIRQSGPLGSLGVPLTPGRSLAADRRLLPRGGLVYVLTQAPVPFDTKLSRDLRRFMLVQDTGGAIRGHGRGDLFWGAGPRAEWTAGHQRHPGRLLLLVAKKEYLRPGNR